MSKKCKERRAFLEKFLALSGVGVVYSFGISGCPAPPPMHDRLNVKLLVASTKFELYKHYIPIDFSNQNLSLLLENDVFGSGGERFTKDAKDFVITLYESNSNKEVAIETRVLSNEPTNQQVEIIIKEPLKYATQYTLKVYSNKTKETHNLTLLTSEIVLDKYVLVLKENESEYVEVQGVWLNNELISENITLMPLGDIEIVDNNLIKVTKQKEPKVIDITAFIEKEKDTQQEKKEEDIFFAASIYIV